MKVWKLLPLLFLVLICSCGKENKKQENASGKHKLVVYATDEFRKSGLEHSVVPDFQKKHNCQLEVILFRNTADLSKAVKSRANYGKYDLAIGIDNSFVMSETLAVNFVPPESFDTDLLIKETVFDPSLRLIPYAYSNLSLVYNTSLVKNPPQSFGELQDAKYLSQIAICDPQTSGLGRTMLFWSVALFGTEGYEHLWKSLRKNIYKTYPNYNETLKTLNRGECSFIIGYNTTPAFLQELDPLNNKFEVSMLKEGSYQYIEAIGIHRGTKKSSLCNKFVNHFLSSEAQKMVIYKLGMFPANRKTLLPMHFSTIPFITYCVNDRLPQSIIKEQINTWLDFWERLFGYQVAEGRGLRAEG
ncbi:MAG: thiamine ABC transporter substrate-binding protein [Candidatus Cloacimonas sp.]|nr:thiamine ABC transporter substrate-binding protein [Candidatus Cloacimonas sp.]